MPGRLPNLKILALFGRSADAFPALALAVAGSPPAGGTRKPGTGYTLAPAGEPKPPARSASRDWMYLSAA